MTAREADTRRRSRTDISRHQLKDVGVRPSVDVGSRTPTED
ncbi:hypothetical protein ACOT81_03225 [Streptomyces sp. WI04-05B]|nr:hypothetical protein [Streptomyces sp. AK08-02]